MTLISSCKKEETKVPATVPAPPPVLNINSIYQANFTIDGIQKSYVYTNRNFHLNNGRSEHITIDTIDNFDYYASIGDTTGVGITIRLGIIKVPKGSAPSYAQFSTLLSPDTISYVEHAGKCLIVEYRDGAKLWQSNYDFSYPINQIGSNFRILSTQIDTMYSGTYIFLKTYMTFNCKLYDANGNVKTLTNGSFIGTFWQY